jgi:ankyrin repeat protein
MQSQEKEKYCHEHFIKSSLRKALVSKKKGDTWTPYMQGGSGAFYDAECMVMLHQLVKNGVSIYVGPCNKYSDTPLHLAFVHQNKPMIKLLLEQGADPHAKRYNGQIPSDLWDKWDFLK